MIPADGTFLENVLDSLKFLPVDLQRNMQLIYQLDTYAERTCLHDAAAPAPAMRLLQVPWQSCS